MVRDGFQVSGFQVSGFQGFGLQGFCSSWPPNCLRMADRILSAKSASRRDVKREYRAVVSTGAGAASSIAAIDVQRPSPESLTRPSKLDKVGSSTSAAAVRSSSHDATTEPRLHTSATSLVSMSYW